MPEVQVTPDTYILRNPATGELTSVPREGAREFASDNHLQPASLEEIERHNFEERNKGVGNVALGALETGVRVGTLGAVKKISGTEEQARERSRYLSEEHPVIKGASQLAAPVAISAAALSTGGTAIVPFLAAEAAIGAYGNIGTTVDQAFEHDQQLSVEDYVQSGFEGAFYGAGTAGVLKGGGSLLGTARNRFIERSAATARQAEAQAFEHAGIVGGTSKTVKTAEDAVASAEVRKAADEAREAFRQDVNKAVDDLHTEAVKVKTSTYAQSVDDAARQSEAIGKQGPPLRAIVQNMEDALPADSPYRSVVQQWKEEVSTAPEREGYARAAESIQRDIASVAEQSRDPDIARLFTESSKHLDDYRANSALFGDDFAQSAATSAEKQAAINEAHQRLTGLLSETDFSTTVGTKTGQQVQEAAQHYADTIKAVNPQAPVDAAAARFAPDGVVAEANRIDALNSSPLPRSVRTRTQPKGRVEGFVEDIGTDIGKELLETTAETFISGVGVLRKMVKYRKHIGQLAGHATDLAIRAGNFLVNGGGAQYTKAVGRIAANRFANSINSEEQYNKTRSSIESLVKQPDVLADMLAQQLGDMASEHPELHMQIAGKTTEALQFLASKLPPAYTYSMTNPGGPPPSRQDMVEMSLYINGVTNVPGVLAGVANGTAMPEEIEAFRAVYPKWFAELQVSTIEFVHNRVTEGKTLSGAKIAQLTNLLDLDGGLDPTFGLEVAEIAHTAEKLSESSAKKSSYVPQPKAGQRIQDSTTERYN